MRHTMISFGGARRAAWLICAGIAAASALIASTAAAGSWHDDFERGGLDDWVIYNFDPGSESWDEKDGFLVGEADPGHMSFLQLKPRKPEGVDAGDWKNYTVRVKMRLESKPRGGQYARFGLLLYDRLDMDLYRLVYLEYQQLNDAKIMTHIRSPRGSSEGGGGPLNLELGVWYELAATIETLKSSENRTIWLNNHVILKGTMEMPLNPLNSGGVGLIVSNGRASFDDFVVEGDSIPNGGNGLPRSVSPAGLSTQLWAEIKKR